MAGRLAAIVSPLPRHDRTPPMRRTLIAAAIAALPTSLAAQGQDVTGIWRCVMNSYPATIEMVVQVNLDQTLWGEGTIILNGTSAMHQVRAPGRWGIFPNEYRAGEYVVGMQFLPQNVATFSIYPGLIGDHNALYNLVPGSQPGTQVETACQRMR